MKASQWPVLALVLGGLVMVTLASVLPPPCDSQIYCTGELLKQVQSAKLFTDDKHFVDMDMQRSPDVILEQFSKLMTSAPGGQVPKEQIWQFVNKSFNPPGQEFEPWTPLDWHSNPKILSRISDGNLQSWAAKLHLLWKSLGRKIKEEVKTNPERHSQIYVPNPVVVPGGRFREFYYWDSYWVINGLLLSEMPNTAKGMIENFLDLVDRYGFVPNGGRVYYLRRSQPPFLTLMMESYIDDQKNKTFLQKNIHLLEKEYEFWVTNRSFEIEINRRNYTLNRYSVQVGEPRPESYTHDVELATPLAEGPRQTLFAELKGAAESGWDFSSRWFVGSSAGRATLTDTRTSTIVPVDLNAILCRVEQLLATFHGMLGNTERAEKFKNIVSQRKEAIHAILWDDSVGSWLDFDLKTRTRRNAFYPSNLSPLWADCMPDPSFVERVVQYLEKTNALSYKNGLPTSLEESGQQWDLPNAWPPLQHMVIEGLAKSSSQKGRDIALKLAQEWVRSNYAAYEKYNAMFEKYDVSGDGRPGGGGEYEVQEGFGWTNGVILQLLDLYGNQLTSGVQGKQCFMWITLVLSGLIWSALAH
ncbi:trehalase isoform X1 [Pleurodeles waltl]|uniref:trehalase isoform X1 n=1 Tax=Pleurodeles waltl TaxID=8319 RepID=UPI0037097E45